MARTLLSLILIGGVCGVLLVGTHHLTADEIQLHREARARALMTEMLGQALPAPLDIQAPAAGDCSDWVFQRVAVNGYAGTINLRVLWRADETLVMRVTQHRETPGIGDFIDHTRDPWIVQLDGLTATEIAHIDNVTGATITTNAIRQAAMRTALDTEDYCRD